MVLTTEITQPTNACQGVVEECFFSLISECVRINQDDTQEDEGFTLKSELATDAEDYGVSKDIFSLISPLARNDSEDMPDAPISDPPQNR